MYNTKHDQTAMNRGGKLRALQETKQSQEHGFQCAGQAVIRGETEMNEC